MFVTPHIIYKEERTGRVSIPLAGQYVCNNTKIETVNTTLTVSIPLAGQYVCNTGREVPNQFIIEGLNPLSGSICL